MSSYRPPRFLERILEWALPTGLSGQGTLGDLGEEFERRALVSPLSARLWYAGQTASLVTYRVFTGNGTESAGGSSALLMDLRWSFRTILKHPGFSLGVVGVLGLGLGANTAVFSVADGTLQNTSYSNDPDRTVAIWPEQTFSFGQLETYRDEQGVYDALGGYVEYAFAVQDTAGGSHRQLCLPCRLGRQKRGTRPRGVDRGRTSWTRRRSRGPGRGHGHHRGRCAHLPWRQGRTDGTSSLRPYRIESDSPAKW
ncbi:MAG: hypothetical protein O2992_09810 [Gemmatimonadetes bacterium]|nr:hypothetical protein [Gemmatimonadota bacterium]